ncbi:portal protein [Paraburkholderia terrae]|uniref:portal protein n=1 Tax=Paraburkholderia terrae TaxID=311230 RepID=UPI001EE15BD1|nr:portal protein [Paraburkholderia terrae]GJH00225.1 hypothetical protein CBA19C8_06730 [Paraburkholderia terrae]
MFVNERVHTDDNPVDRMVLDAPKEPDAPAHPLDSEANVELHGQLLSFYQQELDRQGENRFQQAADEDYYDNIQWTEEEAQVLKDRGQAPIVYNVISTSVNWIIGSEKRNRTDFNILPRKKEDNKGAELKTALLKYLSDVNRTPFARSRAFEDTAKVGIGWIEDGAQDDDDGEMVYSRYESWRNMLWDSAGTELDTSDWRYIFRTKWSDVDVASTYFKDRAALIKLSVTEGARFGVGALEDGDDAMDAAEYDRQEHSFARTLLTSRRERVRLIECWYRTPEQVKRIKGGPRHGEVFDENDPHHQASITVGNGILIDRVMMRVRCAIFTTQGLLWEGPSPYRHNRFPFTPIWGYRRGRDNLPYGVIRGMRDIQDDINKRASKALYILSTNKTIMDEGAVEDIERYKEEIAKPNAVIEKKPGKSLEINVDRELAPAHLDMMSRNIQMLQQVGGVTDELMGKSTQAVSGIAIQRRQDQGSVATNKLFDNLRLAVQIQGETQLSLIEQFFTEEKQFRITNKRGVAQFFTANDGLPENDITRTKADFVVDEAAWNASIRQAQAEMLGELMTKMPPQVALVMLDLFVELMDIPNRDAIVARIRQVTGMTDPDATEPDPEQQAKAAAQAKAQQQQDALLQAELDEKQAKADKTKAEADRIRRQTVGDNVNSTLLANQAAQITIMAPATAAVADAILHESGWNGPGGGLPFPQQQQQPPQIPQQPDNGAAMAPNGAIPNGAALQQQQQLQLPPMQGQPQ